MSNLFKVPGFLRSPAGKLIPDTTILIPNFQDITQVKLQLRWTEEVAKHFEETDPELSEAYRKLNALVRSRLQRLAR